MTTINDIFQLLDLLEKEIESNSGKNDSHDFAKNFVSKSETAQKIISLPVGVFYIIGKYLRSKDKLNTPSSKEYEDVFKHLVYQIAIKHKLRFNFNFGEVTFFQFTRELIEDFMLAEQGLGYADKKIKENDKAFVDGGMNLQNSSHRQLAVKDLEDFIKKAKYLFQNEKVEKAKERIHFLQTA